MKDKEMMLIFGFELSPRTVCAPFDESQPVIIKYSVFYASPTYKPPKRETPFYTGCVVWLHYGATTFRITTLSITILRITTLSMTLSITTLSIWAYLRHSA